jgi:hypothetical protein
VKYTGGDKMDLLERAEKLLKMTESPNQFEAEVARKMLGKFIIKYDIKTLPGYRPIDIYV